MIYKRYKGMNSWILLTLLFSLVLYISGLFFMRCVVAQHIDVFKLDFSKKGEEDKKLEVDFIDVEDSIKYTVAIEKEKLGNKDFNVYDLELLEIPPEDLNKFLWHQVECLIEENISQSHTRKAGTLKCTRSRSGTLYWLADGKKYVHWGRWSFWNCTKTKEEEGGMVK